MEIGYPARRSLVPQLMEWVHQSRIKEHLVPGTFFISFMEDSLHFHLSNLSVHYRTKHVLPNLAAYALSLFNQLKPVIHIWCIKNNIQQIDFQLRFTCEGQRYETTRTIKAKKDNQEYSNYLNNKST